MHTSALLSIKNNFASELEKSQAGEKTSLPFIINEIPEFSLVKDNEVFQVLVIGGTNGISAMVKKTGNSSVILSQEKIILPLLANKEDFFLLIEKYLSPSVFVLALNFAFAIAPVFENGKLDGKLLVGAKGHALRGLVGEKIGAELEQYVYEKQNRKILVSLANDTVCLLLSGLEKAPSLKLSAGIVGSGMNFALFLDSQRAVNLESANFNKFPLSKEGQEIDAESASPGTYQYEKEVAGVYLYKHFNSKLRHNHISYPAVASTEEMNALAQENTGEVGDLARDLIKYSAELVSCQIAAIMEFKKSDGVFVMEGSLFWKGHEYKKTVEETLKTLTNYKADFVEVENSGIIGAAHLVM